MKKLQDGRNTETNIHHWTFIKRLLKAEITLKVLALWATNPLGFSSNCGPETTCIRMTWGDQEHEHAKIQLICKLKLAKYWSMQTWHWNCKPPNSCGKEGCWILPRRKHCDFSHWHQWRGLLFLISYSISKTFSWSKAYFHRCIKFRRRKKYSDRAMVIKRAKRKKKKKSQASDGE